MVQTHATARPNVEDEYLHRPGVLLAEQLLLTGLKAQERADEAEAARRRLAFLFKASQELAVSLDPARIVDVLVEAVVPEFGDGCLVHVLEPGRRTRKSRVATSEALRPWLDRWWDVLERMTRPGVNRVIRTARSEVGSTFHRRRNGAAPGLGGFTYLIVPLRAGGRTVGALTVVALDSRKRYSPEDLVVGEALGAQAGLAIENAHLYAEQRGIVERMEAVRGKLDDAQGEWLRDDERRRIARELHDHVEQTFFAIALTATAALDYPDRTLDPPNDSSSMAQVRELATSGAEQLRAAIFALNHAEFDRRGLIAALWKMVRGFQSRTGIETDLVLTGGKRPVPTEVAEVLHAMAREALANVERHSRAGAVVLGLHIRPRSISLSVHDDGAGAPRLVMKQISKSTTHFGLRGMGDRVRRLHGTLVAGPGSDGGFVVRARIPVPAGGEA
jgi:signal transduction histidine kinase